MDIDMYVWFAVIKSEDDEDGVYAFTNREKAVEFVTDTIVERHTEAGTPSRDIEAIVEDVEKTFETSETFVDKAYKPEQVYYINYTKVN